MRSTLLIAGMALVVACDRPRDDRYFPLPTAALPVVRSEVQAFSVDTVVSGLVRPWSMAFLPDDRVLITERSGGIRIVRDGQLQPEPLKGNVPNDLRDVVLHPRYDDNGWVYISYYANPDSGWTHDAADLERDGGYTVLMRGRLAGDSLVDERVIYRAGPFYERGDAYGSRIAFDPDGYLYFLVGGRTTDERHRRISIQDLDNPTGKTMRLRDDGTVPPDNPFVDSAHALPEIFSLGNRQHQGATLNPETGEIWTTEHGEFGGSEVNILKAGANYGWPLATYSLNYDSTVISEDPLLPGMEPPVHYWTPSIAPSGLDFVFGDRYPGWNGNLFIASLVQTKLLRAVVENNQVVHDESLLEGIGRVRSVKHAPDGFLYVLTEDTGVLVRLLPAEE